MQTCKVIDSGRTSYKDSYAQQLDLVERRKSGQLETDVLIFTEHDPVYTFGRKSKDVIPPLIRAQSFEIERGGEATFHNPGQLVAYPILLLRSDEQDVHLHLRRLEVWILESIRHFGIQGERREGATGVWIKAKNKKIASVGVAVKSWVTYHGVALNVCNDLSGFQKINPCGFEASVMTSIGVERGTDLGISMLDVKQVLSEQFSKVFKREISYTFE